MSNLITVLITCENIDRFTENAIRSVPKDVDILLVHTGMEKRVHDRYRTVHYSFHQNYANLKNFGINNILTPWIFVLDSDEQATNDLFEEIQTILQQKKHIDGFWIPRKTYISKNRYLKHGLFYPDYQLRLFRNAPDYRYTGSIHEQVTIPLKKTAYIQESLIHTPRHPKYTHWSDYKNFLPYIRIEASELSKQYEKQQTRVSKIRFICTGILKGIPLFLNGYIRGKGFLDGWAGFRAHVLLSWSIAAPYCYCS